MQNNIDLAKLQTISQRQRNNDENKLGKMLVIMIADVVSPKNINRSKTKILI